MNRRNGSARVAIEASSGNVYSDLGYAEPEAMLVKARLVTQIAEIIRRRGLTQQEAASLLGLTQPKISGVLKGRFRGISEERLLQCLTRLGRDVQIVIKPARRRSGKMTVRFA
jgi:predicted XRE-type DNA-binding protein